MAEVHQLMQGEKLTSDMMKDGTCIKRNIPKYIKLSDSGLGLITLILTTAIQHQYYEADFNTNGHPPHNRLHVGNAFLIVDAKGQVLVGQLAHTRSNASYDLCGDKVTGSWLPYSISEKQSLGLAYRIPLIHQQPKLVGSNYTTYDWFTERGRAVDVRKFDRDILQLLNTDEPEDLAAAIGPFKEPLEQHDVAKQGHWDAEEQANIDDVQILSSSASTTISTTHHLQQYQQEQQQHSPSVRAILLFATGRD
ncbi:hypothetical protein Q9189_002358 [Teloschistes chrysophthalmus]